MPPLIAVGDISRVFTGGARTVTALEHISCDIHTGNFVSIVGPSGCGKTTLLNFAAGLLPADVIRGRYLVGDKPPVSGNRDIALEAVPELRPDYVIVTEGNPERPTLLPKLRENPALSTMAVFRENRVLAVKASLLSTLSHWNVAGAEQLNRALYPGELP